MKKITFNKADLCEKGGKHRWVSAVNHQGKQKCDKCDVLRKENTNGKFEKSNSQ